MNARAVNARFNPWGGYRLGGLAALALHAGALLAVAQLASQVTVKPTAPIMVSMITAPAPAPAATPEELPRPLPVRPQPRRTQQAHPLLAATNTAEAASETAPAPQAQTPPVAAPTAVAPVAVTAPRFDAAYLDNPPPPYPPLSRRLGEEGVVLLRVLVNADGTAAQVEVKRGSGSPRLDQAALNAVRRWRFVPAKQGGQAIADWAQVPISFTLKG